jgi:hypothetical protein
MSGSDRPEPAVDDGVVFEARPACMALVPMASAASWSHHVGQPKAPLTRPDPTFVTHLIATAEQAPQTRSLRRATPADAQSAYAANRQLQHTGFRTRQVVQA